MDLHLYAGIGAVSLGVILLLSAVPEMVRDLRRYGVPGVITGLKSFIKDVAYIIGFIGVMYVLMVAVGYVVYAVATSLMGML